MLRPVLAPLKCRDFGTRRLQDPLFLRLRRRDLSFPVQLVELIADHLELRLEELSTRGIARRVELRLEVFLCPRKLGAQKALILMLALAREQVADLFPHLGKAAPLDSEGASGLSLRHGEFLHMSQHIAALCFDVGESVLEALQRLGPHRQEHLNVGRGEWALLARPRRRGRRRTFGRRRLLFPTRRKEHACGGNSREKKIDGPHGARLASPVLDARKGL